MCLFVKFGCHVKIAKKKIKVYKRLIKTKKNYRSPYREAFYVRGKAKHSKLIVTGNNYAVYEGLHAFSVKRRAGRCRWRREVVRVMYIPIGAKYIRGCDGDIASSCLVWR